MRILMFVLSACLIVGGLGTCIYKFGERARKVNASSGRFVTPRGATSTVSFPGYDEVYRLVIGIGFLAAGLGVAVGVAAVFMPQGKPEPEARSTQKSKRKKRRKLRPLGDTSDPYSNDPRS